VLLTTASPSPRPIQAFIPKAKVKSEDEQASGLAAGNGLKKIMQRLGLFGMIKK
jgi:hypothetical protein